MPDSLIKVYQNKRLIQNEESAKKWVRLLKQWKKVQLSSNNIFPRRFLARLVTLTTNTLIAK
jgi:hypothetical protein